MRKQIVAGNWKMNKTESESIRLIDEIKAQKLNENVNVFIAPTFVNLASAVKSTKDSGIQVAAQNMHQSSSGAYTGEISARWMIDRYSIDFI